ncbi:reverse transcriptase [Caerostris extrusa]|uniref:Reverse transcriptase n=1 Tax=Caerostris extrusa TaxID=172846 RepID=A0AAV4PDR1_CAEEX|nr:reverse transcriptase [Caerostris extrusa]
MGDKQHRLRNDIRNSNDIRKIGASRLSRISPLHSSAVDFMAAGGMKRLFCELIHKSHDCEEITAEEMKSILKKEYIKKNVDQYINDNVAKEADEFKTDRKMYYSPYREVIRDKSSNKLRIIFDASRMLTEIPLLKTFSLPRSELIGAFLSSRLCQSIQEDLNYALTFYSQIDSSIVYCWMNGKLSRFKLFIKNITEEIQRLTQPVNWFHCSRKLNPADILSKGYPIEKIMKSTDSEVIEVFQGRDGHVKAALLKTKRCVSYESQFLDPLEL